ncbi:MULTISPECIES: hypothetical protein [Trichocoleus]|nr:MULTISPECIES: hypothetical protein [unclassified Trichocoleus]
MKPEFAIPYQTGAKLSQPSDGQVKSILPTPPSSQEPSKVQK